MDKNNVKSILMSMRTQANAERVNFLLGKIDMLSEEQIQKELSKIGSREESVRGFLEKTLQEEPKRQHQEHKPINEMFTYGIAGKTIHLHMPVDLRSMLAKNGLSKTVNTVNLYLLDAIEKVRERQDGGSKELEGKDSIYMISPILVGRELKFLEELDFETRLYRKKDLGDEKFVAKNKEAKLATSIFGNSQNVGAALISMDKVRSKEWQEKRKAKIEQFKEQGIVIENRTIEEK